MNSHPDFTSLFFLSGENDEAVCDFFNSSLVDLFEEFEGYWIEGGDDALLFFRFRSMLQGKEIKDHVDRAKLVYQRIIDRLDC